MIKTKIKNLLNSESYPIEFFVDDTIQVVRQQISKSVNIHPDRLFILIKCELTNYYYKLDEIIKIEYELSNYKAELLLLTTKEESNYKQESTYLLFYSFLPTRSQQ
jgi:hypothetical protein